MPKRSYEDKMNYYMTKMEKLRDKIYCIKRRRHEDNPPFPEQDNQQGNESETWEPILVEPPNENVGLNEKLPGECHTDDRPPSPLQPEPLQSSPLLEPPLDPEILTALGEATDLGPLWGQDIHSKLAELWLPLLRKGLTSEAKDKTLAQYLIPGNCMLLQAPKLNIEISAAITEMARLRDKKVEVSQQQLGAGITAISRALTSLMTSDKKTEVIKMLSDGCRILCDLHYSKTQSRFKMITPGLAKQFLNVIKDSERDETLFGVHLPDKIKASKAIGKQGLQILHIKKIVQAARLTASSQPQNTGHQFHGNWAGPFRYPTNRGGREGQRRPPVSARRSTATATTPATQTKPSQSTSRAPKRQ